MSLLYGLLQRFPAFLIHTSMQGEGPCAGESAPFRKLNAEPQHRSHPSNRELM